MPMQVGLPLLIHSMAIQASAPADAARCVNMIADAALASAASALPPLKPNQPTQSMPAPAIVMPGRCGGSECAGKQRRLAMGNAAQRADTPAVQGTTRPPAKSSVPSEASQPPPQIQCATG